MKRLSKEEIDVISSMRSSGKTIIEIAEETGRNKSTIHYWTKGTHIDDARMEKARRAASQSSSSTSCAKRVAYQRVGRDAAKSLNPLHVMGCMLYWAEGTKSGNSLTFANSDPDMIAVFVKFLRECLLVNNSKIKIRLNCYETPFTPFNLSVEFWKSVTGLSDDNFTKSTIQAGSDNGKHRHGICYISVHDVGAVQHIYGAIQEYIGIDKPEFEKLGSMARSKYR